MNKEEKIFDTAFRILEILKYLSNENLSKTDLIKKLSNQDKTNNVYSFEAFIKYFNTLNFLGLNIQKDKNIYILKNALYSLTLSDEEKKLFYEIIENVHLLHNEKMENVVKDVVYRVVKYVNDGEIDTAYLDKLIEKSKEKSVLSVNNTVISSLKTIIKDNPQVKIEFLTKQKVVKSLIVELKEIREKNDNVFIKDITNKQLNANELIQILGYPCHNAIIASNNISWEVWYSDALPHIQAIPYLNSQYKGFILAASNADKSYMLKARHIEHKII